MTQTPYPPLPPEGVTLSDLMGRLKKIESYLDAGDLAAMRELKAQLERAIKERDALAKDLTDAAGAFTVPLPEPGSDMAKVMSANRLLKRERDAARSEVERLRSERASALALLAAAGEDTSDLVGGLRVFLGCVESIKQGKRLATKSVGRLKSELDELTKDHEAVTANARGYQDTIAECHVLLDRVSSGGTGLRNRVAALVSRHEAAVAECDEAAAQAKGLGVAIREACERADVLVMRDPVKSLAGITGRLEAALSDVSKLEEVLQQRNDQACAAAADVGIDAQHITEALEGKAKVEEATTAFDDMRRDIRDIRSERDDARRERDEARESRDGCRAAWKRDVAQMRQAHDDFVSAVRTDEKEAHGFLVARGFDGATALDSAKAAVDLYNKMNSMAGEEKGRYVAACQEIKQLRERTMAGVWIVAKAVRERGEVIAVDYFANPLHRSAKAIESWTGEDADEIIRGAMAGNVVKVESRGLAKPETRDLVAVIAPSSEAAVMMARVKLGSAEERLIEEATAATPITAGEIKVKVRKAGGGRAYFDKPIAQLVIAPVARVVVEQVDVLSETKRGAGGFGSTDKSGLHFPKSADYVAVKREQAEQTKTKEREKTPSELQAAADEAALIRRGEAAEVASKAINERIKALKLGDEWTDADALKVGEEAIQAAGYSDLLCYFAETSAGRRLKVRDAFEELTPVIGEG